MNPQYVIKIPTLTERLQEEGFKRVAEFDANGTFPLEIVPRADMKVKRHLDDNLPGVELRIVDKAELNPNYKPGRVYEVYKR